MATIPIKSFQNATEPAPRELSAPTPEAVHGEDAGPVILKFPGGQRGEELAHGEPPETAPAPSSTATAQVAIVLPNWIGDLVMATPTLRALREHYGPEAKLLGLAKPYVTTVLDGNPWLDELVHYSPRSSDASQHVWPVAADLRRRRIDTVVVMNRSLRSALLARLSGAKVRVGYGGTLHRLLLWGRKTSLRRGTIYSPLDRYLALASVISGQQHERRLELATLRADERAADRVWQRFGLWDTQLVIALNGGSGMGDAKHWPLESFSELARRLVESYDASVLIMCGPGEREAALQIAARANHPRVHSMADQDLSLGTAKACLRRVNLLVSTDSGPRHLAAAFGVPTVSLLGPMADYLSQNYHAGDLLLRAEVGCAPCGKHICPLGENVCMREITVPRVLAAVRQQLAQQEMQLLRRLAA